MNAAADPLEQLAAAARAHAHCPYSGYAVGAAIETRSGRRYVGANVENASYGLTICAERAAVCAMVADGPDGDDDAAARADARAIARVVIVARDAPWPCGACRQVLAEFAGPDCRIESRDPDDPGTRRVSTLGELFPGAFRLDD